MVLLSKDAPDQGPSTADVDFLKDRFEKILHGVRGDVQGGGDLRCRICQWLARLAHTEVGSLVGGHACYLDRPEETASRLRPYLQQLTALQLTEQEG